MDTQANGRFRVTLTWINPQVKLILIKFNCWWSKWRDIDIIWLVIDQAFTLENHTLIRNAQQSLPLRYLCFPYPIQVLFNSRITRKWLPINDILVLWYTLMTNHVKFNKLICAAYFDTQWRVNLFFIPKCIESYTFTTCLFLPVYWLTSNKEVVKSNEPCASELLRKHQSNTPAVLVHGVAQHKKVLGRTWAASLRSVFLTISIEFLSSVSCLPSVSQCVIESVAWELTKERLQEDWQQSKASSNFYLLFSLMLLYSLWEFRHASQSLLYFSRLSSLNSVSLTWTTQTVLQKQCNDQKGSFVVSLGSFNSSSSTSLSILTWSVQSWLIFLISVFFFYQHKRTTLRQSRISFKKHKMKFIQRLCIYWLLFWVTTSQFDLLCI